MGSNVWHHSDCRMPPRACCVPALLAMPQEVFSKVVLEVFEVFVYAASLPAAAAKHVREKALGILNTAQKQQLMHFGAQQRARLQWGQNMGVLVAQQAAKRATALREYGQGRAAQIQASCTANAAVTRQYGSTDDSVIRDSSLAMWVNMGVSTISRAITVFSNRKAECSDVSTAGRLCQGVLDGVVAELKKPRQTAKADVTTAAGEGLAALAPAVAVAMPDTMHTMSIAVTVAARLTKAEVVAVGIFNDWLTGESAMSGHWVGLWVGFGCEGGRGWGGGGHLQSLYNSQM